MANSSARLFVLFLTFSVFTVVTLAQAPITTLIPLPPIVPPDSPSPLLPASSPHGATIEVENAHQGTWCMAKPSTSDAVLEGNIQFICSMLDCSPIQKDGPCFVPDTYINHASWAMNLYYKTKPGADCYFDGSGIIVTNDPSNGNCKYD